MNNYLYWKWKNVHPGVEKQHKGSNKSNNTGYGRPDLSHSVCHSNRTSFSWETAGCRDVGFNVDFIVCVRMDDQTDGWTDGRIIKWADGWMDVWKNREGNEEAWMDKWTKGSNSGYWFLSMVLKSHTRAERLPTELSVAHVGIFKNATVISLRFFQICMIFKGKLYRDTSILGSI